MKTVNNEDGRSAYEAPTITVLTLELEMGLAQQTVVTSATDGGYGDGGTLPGVIGDDELVGGDGTPENPGFGGFN
jgi:hypothetical protein